MLSRARRRAIRSLIASACAALVVAGCSGSSTHPSHQATPSATPSTPPASALARHLEQALLAKKGPPLPTAATCRAATAGEVAAGPFGSGATRQFTCQLTVRGSRALYDVQIQGNGCFVAERHRKGQAIYGCGVRGLG